MAVVPPHLGDNDTDPSGPPPAARSGGTGLGPFLLVLLYCGVAAAVVYYSYIGSTSYRVAAQLRAGDAILGSDQGRSASLPDLETAARHYLTALSLEPNQQWAWQELKSVHWRFQERGASFPRSLGLEEAAVAEKASKPEDTGLFGQLPIKPRDRYPDALADIQSTITYASIGFVMVFLWAIWSFIGHRRELARVRRTAAQRQADTSAMY